MDPFIKVFPGMVVMDSRFLPGGLMVSSRQGLPIFPPPHQPSLFLVPEALLLCSAGYLNILFRLFVPYFFLGLSSPLRGAVESDSVQLKVAGPNMHLLFLPCVSDSSSPRI